MEHKPGVANLGGKNLDDGKILSFFFAIPSHPQGGSTDLLPNDR